MKKQLNWLKYFIFIITYSLSCLTVTSNNESYPEYLRYTGTDQLFLKFGLFIICTFAATLLNKRNLNRVTSYVSVFLNIALVLFAFDSYRTHYSGTDEYYRMWWLCAIFMTQIGFYFGLAASKPDNFKKLSRQFWLMFLPIYIYTFLLVFARTPDSYFSVNLELGKGLLSGFDYMKNNFHYNTYSIFNFVGNLVFFMPVPYMIKATFPKMKNIFVLLIALCVPFLVEGYQYVFRCGNVDIDDIVFNCSGTTFGFIMFLIEQKIFIKE